MKPPVNVRTDVKRVANEEETLLGNILMGSVSRLVGGRPIGVVIVAELPEIVPGAGPGIVVKLVSAPDDRSNAFRALAQFMWDRRDEVPRGPGRAA
jgi:hypothetical protein